MPLNGKTCCPLHTIRLDVERAAPSRAQRRVLRRMSRYLAGDDPRVAAAAAPVAAAAAAPPADALAGALHARVGAALGAADAAAGGALLGEFTVRGAPAARACTVDPPPRRPLTLLV